jgi:hypothetical protein
MRRRDPLLVEVLTGLGAVQVKERYLVDGAAKQRNFCHGEYLDGVVTVNPAPSVVETLVHELLHHVRPAWSERAVRARTTRLIREMSHRDVQAVYAEYRKRVEP